jgi:hypothetical protein
MASSSQAVGQPKATAMAAWQGSHVAVCTTVSVPCTLLLHRRLQLNRYQEFHAGSKFRAVWTFADLQMLQTPQVQLAVLQH